MLNEIIKFFTIKNFYLTPGGFIPPLGRVRHVVARLAISNVENDGQFSMEEINYIIRVLGAGSLQAKLSPEPLSENVIAPELGQDNLDAGIGETSPSTGIGLVILAGNYDLVSVLPHRTHCMGQNIDILSR